MQKKHVVLVLALLILAILFWSSYGAQVALEKLLTTSQTFITDYPLVSAIIFISLSALAAMFAFLSSVVLIPIVTFSWGPILTFFLIFSGWLLGGVLTWSIGKYLGRAFVEYLFSPEKINYYEEKISTKLNFFLVFLFRLAIPAEIPGYLLGILRYNFTKYFLATALAELPFALGAVYASEFFFEEKRGLFVGLLILGLILMSTAFYLFRKKSKNSIK